MGGRRKESRVRYRKSYLIVDIVLNDGYEGEGIKVSLVIEEYEES